MMKQFHLSIISLFCAIAASAAPDTVTVQLDLTRCTHHSLHVVIRTPHISRSTVRFILPSNVPGCVAEVKTGKLLTNLTATAADRSPLPMERLSLNEYQINSADRLTTIEYDIHDSWHWEDPHILIAQIGTSYDPDHQFLLNYHAIAGYIEGYEGATYRVEIDRPVAMNGYGVAIVDTASLHHVFYQSSYLALIDAPMLYTRIREQCIYSGHTRYHICLTTDSVVLHTADVVNNLRPVIEAADSFCGGFDIRDYYFLFMYGTPTRHEVKSEEEYGAVEHSGSSVYFLPENGNRYKTQRELQLSVAHELMHLYPPLQIKTDATNRLNMRAKLKTSNLWLYEGFTEYLSLLMLYRAEVLTEQEYIGEIRNKMSLSQHYEPFSLTDMSEHIYIDGFEKNYRNFYQKGALIGMMLDLRLLKISKGEMSLQSLLKDIHDHARSNYVIKDDQVIAEMVKYSYPDIQDFFENYVRGTKPIDYNENLSVIGWHYTPVKIDTAHLYVNASFRYTKSSREVYATNISLDQIGMDDGDVLTAINGKRITKENMQSLLDKYCDLHYDKPVTFTVRRNNELKDLTGTPLTVTKNQRNLITVEREVVEEKKKYRKRYAGGGLHRNKAFKSE